jgi:hypothetical protein
MVVRVVGDKDKVVVESALGAVPGSAFGVAVGDGPDFEIEQMVRDALRVGCKGGSENFVKGLFGEVRRDAGGVSDLDEDMEGGSMVGVGVRGSGEVGGGAGDVIEIIKDFSNNFGSGVRGRGSGGGSRVAVRGNVDVEVDNLFGGGSRRGRGSEKGTGRVRGGTEEILGIGEVGETFEDGAAETVNLGLGDGPRGVDAALAAVSDGIEFGPSGLQNSFGGVGDIGVSSAENCGVGDSSAGTGHAVCSGGGCRWGDGGSLGSGVFGLGSMARGCSGGNFHGWRKVGG